MKAFTMQSKNKIGAWAHMRPPLSHIILCKRNHCGDDQKLIDSVSEDKVVRRRTTLGKKKKKKKKKKTEPK